MYLFTRQARLSGQAVRSATTHAIHLAEHVTQTTGNPVQLWAKMWSSEPGTLVWTTAVPDLTALEAAFDKLTADGAYTDMVERNREYFVPGSLADQLAEIVYPSDPAPEQGRYEYAAVVSSQMLPGRLTRGVGVGIEAAARAEELVDGPVTFLTAVTGGWAGVAWILQHRDAAACEAALHRIYGDGDFMSIVDGPAAEVFAGAVGSSTQELYRRVA